MLQPAISVIVPVYNAENFLHKCVDSLLAQSFTDFEILLINDGSFDRSGEICDEYAEKDARIRVYHKKNEGVGATRRFGVEISKGVYSIQVDSDDWVSTDFLCKLYKKAIETDADVVFCDFVYVYSHGNQLKTIEFVDDREEMLCRILIGNVHGSLCNKLIRNALLKKKDIFIEGVNFMEDMVVCCKILYMSHHLSYVSEGLYFYNKTVDNSATSSHSMYRFQEDLYRVSNQMLLYQYQNPCSFKLKKAFRFSLAGILTTLLLYGNIPSLMKNRTLYASVCWKDIYSHPQLPIYYKAIGGIYKLHCFSIVQLINSFTSRL